MSKNFDIEELRTPTVIAKEFAKELSYQLQYCEQNNQWYVLQNSPPVWMPCGDAVVVNQILDLLALKKEAAVADVKAHYDDAKKQIADTTKEDVRKGIIAEHTSYMKKMMGWIAAMENGNVYKVKNLMMADENIHIRLDRFNQVHDIIPTKYGYLNLKTGEYMIMSLDVNKLNIAERGLTAEELNELHAHYAQFCDKDAFGDPIEIKYEDIQDNREQCNDLMLTRSMSVQYDPSASYKDWDRMLNDTFPDPDVKDFFEQVIGYTFDGNHKEQLIVDLHGPPNSGKTTLVKGIMATAGQFVCMAKYETFTLNRYGDGSRFGLAGIMDALMVIVPELPADRMYNHSIVKSFSSGEPMRVEEKGKPEYDSVPKGVPFMMTNHELCVDPIEARSIEKRYRVIPFDRVFDGTSFAAVDERIEKCKVGILNWIIMCIRKYRSNGGLIEPAIIRKRTTQIMAQFRTVKTYLDITVEPSTTDSYVVGPECVQEYNLLFVDVDDPAMRHKAFYKIAAQEGYKFEVGAHNQMVLRGYRRRKPLPTGEPVATPRASTHRAYHDELP